MSTDVPHPQSTPGALGPGPKGSTRGGQLPHQRCFHHGSREAAARCPECRNYFCRECITEHEHRVVCTSCLKKLVREPFTRRPAWVGLMRSIQLGFGVLLAWAFFYWLGLSLLELPSAFHDGTVWRGRWLDEGPAE